jgi:hypothetical protein
MGEILDNNSFRPVAIGPFGETGSLFNRFWDGSSTLPLPSFNEDKPNAKRAAERAIDLKTPWGRGCRGKWAKNKSPPISTKFGDIFGLPFIKM